MPIVNRLVRAFAHVVVTQDWHPEGHASFASSHEGAKPFDVVRMPYGEQVLWPDHCVQGAPGAALHEALDVDAAFLILRKGVNAEVDSYSAFTEADGKTTTGLAALLRRGARAGCSPAAWRPITASLIPRSMRAPPVETFVIDDACRAIDANGSLEAAWSKMNAAQVWRSRRARFWGRAGSPRPAHPLPPLNRPGPMTGFSLSYSLPRAAFA